MGTILATVSCGRYRDCGSTHHTLLHAEREPTPSSEVAVNVIAVSEPSTVTQTDSLPDAEPASDKVSINAISIDNAPVDRRMSTLYTAFVEVHANTACQSAKLLLDTEAQIFLISMRLASNLTAKRVINDLSMSGVHMGCPHIVNVMVAPVDGDSNDYILVSCQVVDSSLNVPVGADHSNN